MLPFSGGSELLGVSVAIEGVKNWNTSAGGGGLLKAWRGDSREEEEEEEGEEAAV